MTEVIYNCYDSHTHFWATGQISEGLKLHDLKSASGIRDIKVLPQHRRGNWIVGFGWDQNNWPGRQFPDKSILDEIFPSVPVFFSRVDGHASWVNSAALSELEKLGFRPSGGTVSGILLEQDHIGALIRLPEFDEDQHRHFFKVSQQIFNRAGFTHVRDLSMNLQFWRILRGMEDKKELSVFLDAFVTAENLQDIPRVLKEIENIKSDRSEQMRLHGVKIFIDGSLGSKTAWLSQDYVNSSARGQLLWKSEEIKEALRLCWKAHQQVAVHCIGDQAAHEIVTAARAVSAEGIAGRLHLEHVEILRSETVQMMKPLHVTCYLQPCHWRSDHKWLKQVVPETLIKNIFPWEALRKNKIPFFFGSDSPIERPSLSDNLAALTESSGWGVPALGADWKAFHSHPGRGWGECRTELSDGRVSQVYFKGQSLL